MLRAGSKAYINPGGLTAWSTPAAPLAFGSVPSKLFTPLTATPATRPGLFVYVNDHLGTDNDISQSSVGQLVVSNPADWPMFVWFPQLPLSNGDSTAQQHFWQAVIRGLSQLLAGGVMFDINKIGLSGYSASGTAGCEIVMDYPNLFAYWAGHDVNMNRNNLVGQPSVSGLDPSGFIMDPSTIITNTDCFVEAARRLGPSKTSLLWAQGDLAADAVNDTSGLFTALSGQGYTTKITTTDTYATTDRLVQSIFPSATHANMENAPWASGVRANRIAWMNAQTRAR